MRTVERIRPTLVVAGLAALLLVSACRGRGDDHPRATGYVEATEVRVAPEVGGRILDLRVDEGDRVKSGDIVARLDTADAELALQRLQAEHDQAAAQVRLLQAGARPEDIRQARAQVDSANADVRAALAEQASADADLQRFEALLASNAGSRKQRDDAATRKEVATAHVNAARERARAAAANLARLQAGARVEEVAAARARVAAVEAQMAAVQKNIADAGVTSPVSGLVTAKLADAGEVVAPRTPLLVVTDLDHAWANLYVDEPMVPALKLGQTVDIVTDAGQTLKGTITFISPKAEFTPRNVQTSEERSKLVYRIKVTTNNSDGILKTGMPVEGRF
jgi:HlyD family secretion protein